MQECCSVVMRAVCARHSSYPCRHHLSCAMNVLSWLDSVLNMQQGHAAAGTGWLWWFGPEEVPHCMMVSPWQAAKHQQLAGAGWTSCRGLLRVHTIHCVCLYCDMSYSAVGDICYCILCHLTHIHSVVLGDHTAVNSHTAHR